MKFEWNIIGHKNIIHYLENCIISDTNPQAFIFLGQDGIGKETVAQQYSHILLCDKKDDRVPCNNCNSCKQFIAKIHPDYYYIKRGLNEKTKKIKKNISIEQVLSIQNSLSKYSLYSGHTIVIIPQAEYLSEKASNALLKTLEEPNSKNIIVLISTNLQNFPKTIISRCAIVKFYPVTYNVIYDYLISLGCTRNDADIYSRTSLGSPGDAINFFIKKNPYKYYSELIHKFIEIINNPIYLRLKILSNILNTCDDNYIEITDSLIYIIQCWLSVIRDIMLIKNNSKHMITNIFIRDKLYFLAKIFTNKKINDLQKKLLNGKIQLLQNIHPKLILENIIINI